MTTTDELLLEFDPCDDRAEIREVMRGDVVIAFWPDPNLEGGQDKLIIKGAEIVQRIMETNTSESASFGVIPCGCAEDAYLLKQLIDEAPGRH